MTDRYNIDRIRDLDNKISEEELDTIKLTLDALCRVYYNTGLDTDYTDKEFDELLSAYKLHREYTTGAKPSSSMKKVDVSHIAPELVGNTDKSNNMDDLKNWAKERLKEIGKDFKEEVTLLVSIKYDGNSVVEFYKPDGTLKVAITRGIDGIGADVTEMIYASNNKIEYKEIKEYMSDDSLFAIKNEAIVTYDNFEKYNGSARLNGNTYANPRSMVTGLLSTSKYGDVSDIISLVPLEVKVINPLDSKMKLSREEQLVVINNLLIPEEQKNMSIEQFVSYRAKGNIDEIMNDIEDLYNDYQENTRSKLDYMIDGLVIEFLDEEIRKQLGRKNNKNNYDNAIKFEYQQALTTVKDIRFDYGKTGTITPVVHFDELIFNGSKCEYVSIANYARFKELNLSYGEEVIIQYRNDVLSYLIKSPTNKVNDNPIPFIENCPSCNSDLIITVNDKGIETFVKCTNEECSSNITGKLVNYLIKIGLKGIKESTMQKLVDSELVTSIPDLYTLNEIKMSNSNIEGLGKKSIKNILDTINSKKTMYDYELISAMGIPNCSTSIAKLIFSNYTLDELDLKFNVANPTDIRYPDKNKFIDKLTKIDGIGNIIAENIYNFYMDKGSSILWRTFLEIDDLLYFKSTPTLSDDDKIRFIFTGFRDKKLSDKLIELGHELKSSVSKNVDIVVVKDGEEEKSNAKLDKARSLGKKIMGKSDFIKLMEK